MLQRRRFIGLIDQLLGKPPNLSELAVLKDFLLLVIHHQQPIETALGLRAEERRLPAQTGFGAFPFFDLKLQ